MAGCSIIMLMTLMLPIMAMGVAAGFGILIYLLYSYVLESIFCVHLCRNLWSTPPLPGWIPLWGQYLLGVAAGSRGMGAALALDHLVILGLCMAVAAEYVLVDSAVFLLLIGSAIVLKAILAHRLYKIAAPEQYKVLSILSILTIGILRPVFLFALRKKVCMFSKNT